MNSEKIQPNLSTFMTLGVIPTAILVVAILAIWLGAVHPADPDYAYLLNGVRFSIFRAPFYTGHPGTTVLWVAAAVIDVVWILRLPFGGLSKIQMDVLTSPEIYLWSINLVLLAGVAAALLYFGWKVYSATNSLLSALVGQASFLLSFAAIQELPRVTPEPMILAVTLVLAGALVPAIFGEGPSRGDTRYAAAIGALIAIAIISKVTAAPLLIALLLLRHGRLIAIGAGAFVGASILLTLPIASRYLEMLQWFLDLATHRGHYGAGEKGLPDGAVLIGNLWRILQGAPELVICLIASAGFALLLWRTKVDGALRRGYALLIVAVILGAQFIVVAKHFGLRYLIPVVGIACLGNAIVMFSASLFGSARRIVSAAIGALVAVGLLSSAIETQRWLESKRVFDAQKTALLERVVKAGCTLIAYGESTPEFSLSFGHHWANSAFTKYFSQMYPGYLEYDFGSRSFQGPEGRLDRAALDVRLASEKCVYLIGTPIRPEDNFPVPASRLVLIDQVEDGAGRALSVYQSHLAADGFGAVF